jgi:transmembrane sensor
MNPSARAHLRTDRRIRAQAAAWIAKLHGPERTRELENGFRQWLTEHPAHALEFELATDAWNETAGIAPAPALPASGRRRHVLRPRAMWSLAAGLALCVLGALWTAHMPGRSTVATGIGQQKAVTLPDGSMVTLNTDSRIVIHYRHSTRTVILRYGEAYFQVLHNPDRPFVVMAGNRKVIDVGTSFVVRRNGVGEGSLSVTVVRGRVAVAPLDIADILARVPPIDVLYVSAGDRLLLRAHALPRIRAEPADQATAWLRGKLIFNSTRLGDAAIQFNRYNRVKIIVAAPQLKQIRVAGVFRTDSSKGFALAVAADHHLRLIVRPDALVLEPGGDRSDAGGVTNP